KQAGVVIMQVEDTVRALGALARFYRRNLCGSVNVVAVTGTNGKTTVREMIYHVLSRFKKGHRSPRNYNNHIGVPLTIFGIEAEHDFAVVEIGTNAPGEVAALSRIAEPDIAVITRVGPSHLEGLKDVEGVSVEKVSIVAGLKEHGVLVCGVNHPPTLERVKALGKHLIKFGLDTKCDVYAEKIERDKNGVRFVTNDRCEIRLGMLGVHNVNNALAALAVVRRLGITSEQFSQSLKDFKPAKGRMECKEVNGITIIDDSYNANPVSMTAALEELVNFPQAKRRVFVAGDMYELGEESDEFHRELGRKIARKGVELLLTVGPRGAQVAEAALEAGMGRGSIMRCKNSKRMARLIKSMLFNGDVVLVKGSRAMEMEKVIVSLDRWKGRI
ncbi:MAG: UDP-N-acetylmuramoyl-tripeptide--D-alanyl-D-alanine ligase, partial [Sedimentisphaerales bacterium]|nr:UDP-N-acetylmuramoyl-tripeptide--D-alanyl-D-alanine ligase [Sedimentisphaerales bacterium]